MALVIDDDPVVRYLVRTALELEGVVVVEAGSIAETRAMEGPVDAVVLDRDLPDGDGLDHYDALREQFGAPIVVHSNRGAPEGFVTVEKGDIPRLLSALALPSSLLPLDAAPDVARRRADELVDAWTELCRWDPEEPPESVPPAAEAVVDAVAAALERPQPLGWGLDPALEPLADLYMRDAGALDVSLAQLVCLREAFARVVVDQLPPDERAEASDRLAMIVERLMTEVVRAGSRELRSLAFSDPLTGLLNRRAFEADLAAERARAARHQRPLTLVAIDLDGLKVINDEEGHAVGDVTLKRLADALTRTLRAEDRAYRVGGDEFALLLVDTVLTDPDALMGRLLDRGAPACSLGVATHPEDPLRDLARLADERLYERRRNRETAS